MRWSSWLKWSYGLFIAGWILLGACQPGTETRPVKSGQPSASSTSPTASLSPQYTLNNQRTTQTSELTTKPQATATISPTPIKPTATSAPLPTESPWLVEMQYEPWELVLALAWSPEGKRLAIAAGDYLSIYSGDSLQLMYRLKLNVWVEGLTFNPATEGQLALAGRDGIVQLLEVDTGKITARWLAHPKGARSLDFSPDGQLLASAGNDAIVYSWDLANLSELQEGQTPPSWEMIGGAYAVSDVRFSPDGHLLASTDGNVIRLREASTQRLVRSLRGESPIFSLAFSPDGTWLAAAELGRTVRLWDVESGETVRSLKPASGPVGDQKHFFWRVAFSPDGKILAAGDSDGWVIVWDPQTGAELSSWQAHTQAVTSLAFSPDGLRLATGGLDATVKIWETTSFFK